jgi:hypothetical protein
MVTTEKSEEDIEAKLKRPRANELKNRIEEEVGPIKVKQH